MDESYDWGEITTNYTQRGSDCDKNGSDYLNFYRHKENYFVNNATPIIEIPINFIVFWDSNAQPNNFTNQQQLQGLIDIVNDTYANLAFPNHPVTCVCQNYTNPQDQDCHVADSKIRFYIANVFYHVVPYSSSQDQSEIIQYDVNSNNTINYFIRTYDNGTAGGTGNGLGSDPLNHILAVTSEDYYYAYINGNAYGVGKNIAHELGHLLGLGHTYNGFELCTTSNIDYLSDIFGDGSPECSTPCPHTKADENDCNAPGAFCTNNLMGIAEAEYLSPQQLGIIQRNLRFGAIRKYVGNCTKSSQPWIVSQNETWDFSIRMYEDIVVKSGATLTIKCEVLMPENAKIIVERGARLVVDGGVITSACTDKFWAGIEVWGNSAFVHKPFVLSEQGIVELKNYAHIENAVTGISTKRSGYGAEYFGGVVYAQRSTFKNNNKAIEFLKYPYPNASYIDDCEFFLEKPTNHTAISMWATKNIRILNSEFRVNKPIANPELNQAANAIETIDASYTVDNNFFRKFEHVVQCENLTNAFYKVTVTNNDFILNHIGFYGRNTTNCTIRLNNFDDNHYGVAIESESFFEISDNDFIDCTEGIVCTQTGAPFNYVLGNRFVSNIHYSILGATTAQGDNSFLSILCNDFDSKYNITVTQDFDIYTNTITPGSIMEIQGSEDQPAGNLFTDLEDNPDAPFVDHIFSLGTTSLFSYYYSHSILSDPREEPTNDTQANYIKLQANGVSTCSTYLPEDEVPCPPDDRDCLHTLIDTRADLIAQHTAETDSVQKVALKHDILQKQRQIQIAIQIQAEAAIEQNDVAAIEDIYNSEGSYASQKKIIGTLIQLRAWDKIGAYLSNLNQADAEQKAFYDMAMISLRIYRNNKSSLTATERTRLTELANNTASTQYGYARNLLHFFDGTIFPPKEVADRGTAKTLTYPLANIGNESIIQLLPNPANNLLFLVANSKNEKITAYSLYNYKGELLRYQNQLQMEKSESTTIDVSYLPNGIYFIKVVTDKGMYSQKVMIQH
ncbi:MAG: T9SS type A sorting domain-containing protein [Bacteroidetes bacterium]|nr:T9SS type A sorting domain-containing protein [Bacteroidota bacterium]